MDQSSAVDRLALPHDDASTYPEVDSDVSNTGLYHLSSLLDCQELPEDPERCQLPVLKNTAIIRAKDQEGSLLGCAITLKYVNLTRDICTGESGLTQCSSFPT